VALQLGPVALQPGPVAGLLAVADPVDFLHRCLFPLRPEVEAVALLPRAGEEGQQPLPRPPGVPQPLELLPRPPPPPPPRQLVVYGL
jgi:hypothetical protein